MHLRIWLCIFSALAVYSISKAENVDEKQTKCFGLCKEFVSFIYEMIQRKSLATGVSPMQTLYNMAKTQAKEFCSKRIKHAEEVKLNKDTFYDTIATIALTDTSVQSDH